MHLLRRGAQILPAPAAAAQAGICVRCQRGLWGLAVRLACFRRNMWRARGGRRWAAALAGLPWQGRRRAILASLEGSTAAPVLRRVGTRKRTSARLTTKRWSGSGWRRTTRWSRRPRWTSCDRRAPARRGRRGVFGGWGAGCGAAAGAPLGRGLGDCSACARSRSGRSGGDRRGAARGAACAWAGARWGAARALAGLVPACAWTRHVACAERPGAHAGTAEPSAGTAEPGVSGGLLYWSGVAPACAAIRGARRGALCAWRCPQ